jgi:hypothetical protein
MEPSPQQENRASPVWQVLRATASQFASCNCSKAVRKSGNDEYDKFSLPTGSGFLENILEVGARRSITGAKFDRSGIEVFLV